MKRFFKFFNILILIWGYVCLLIVGLIATQITWNYMKWSNTEGNSIVSANEAQKIVHRLLGWNEIKVEKVIYGYESLRSFTGDGIDVYYVQLDSIPPLEGGSYDWHRGDSINELGKKSVEFMDGWKDAKRLEDFQNEEGELLHSGNYFYLRSTKFHGDFVSDATVIMINPSKKLYYYFSGNT